MASGVYKAILERKLGRQIKDNTRDADLLSSIERKGELLKGSIILRSDDPMDPSVADAAFEAASERVDQLLDDITIGQGIFDKESKTVKYKSRGKVDVPSTIYGLTDKRGRILSGLALARILNITLANYIKELMGTKGRLRYQTGRLANSANVNGLELTDKIANQRKNRVSIYFSYLIAPYSVFEPGHRMHKPGRSPSRLIKDALKQALQDTLSARSFANHIFNTEYRGAPI